MHRLYFLFVLLLIFSGHSLSQTALVVRLNGEDGVHFDSTRVLLEDGTGDTTYGRIPVSGEGVFALVIRAAGDYLLQVSSPGFRPLEVALVVSTPVKDTMEVMLTPVSQPSRESRIAFRDGSSLMAKFALLHMNSTRRLRLFGDEHSAFIGNGGDESEFAISWRGEEAQNIVDALSREKEPLLREELVIQFTDLNGLKNDVASTDTIKRWLPEVRPSSPSWVYHLNQAFASFIYMPWEQTGFAYQNRVAAEHPNRFFRARMLYEFARLYKAMGDQKKLDSTVTILQHNYPGVDWAKRALLLISPIRVGDGVPEFNLRSIDDTLKYFSSRNMLGKVYLIDFWGTWCGACLSEMPHLHRAYERFAKYGFTILSISSDGSVQKVQKFRKGKWKMPWLNAFIGSPADQPIVRAFGVSGWPTPVLVDAKGKILAIGYADLSGDQLESVIGKYVGR
jgi:thiol-disulfide isomerase/thioredoxin